VTVVPHTHWDREWYRPFQVFRARLVNLLDDLLEIMEEQKNFRHFHLDGQAVMLEDYLEVWPERAPLIRKLVGEGRLSVGPWYVLPDEFLVSGESLIRNLLFGLRAAARFGPPSRIGYLPDMFGHIAQMPQILRGFGLEGAVLWRGLDYERSRHNEFRWAAPDGSLVLAVHLPPRGYGGLALLSQDPEGGQERVKKLLEFLVPRSASGEILLLSGDDHMPAAPGLPDFLARLAAAFPGVEFRLGSLEEFFDRMRASLDPELLAEVRGELNSPKDTRVLQSVYSTRMPLKQLNFRCETLLVRWAEPTFVYAAWLGYPPPRGFLELAWKWLLKNHPHDSICGCSVDQVERDMRVRFAWAQEIGEELVQRNLQTISLKVNTSELLSEGEWGLLAFNPSSQEGPQLVEGECILPGDLAGEELSAVSQEGEELPVEVLPVECAALKGPELLAEGIPPEPIRARLRFTVPRLPPHGYAVFRLRRGNPPPPEELGAGEGWIENRYYRVQASPDGTLEVVEKETGQLYSGLHRFEDLGDRGDTYTFDPVPGDSPIHQSRARIETSLHPARASLVIRTELLVPEGLAPSRAARAEKRVQIPIETTVTLYPGIKLIYFATRLENTARDHRLRVLFPTGVRADAVWAGGAFEVLRRPIEVPTGEGWAEAPYPTKHFRPFVYLGEGARGLGLITRGLPEYEVLGDGEGTLALTLLRCVGWLSRHDLERRRDAAGPSFPTPGAQCLGRHQFEYALYTARGHWEKSGILQAAEHYIAPARPWTVGSHPGLLPSRLSFLRVTPAWVPVSAVKPAQAGGLSVVRLYNPPDWAVEAELTFPWGIERAVRLNLAAEELGELEAGGKSVRVSLRPKEIFTLGVALAAPGRGDG
jgi:alpha-mannosidase